MQIVRPDTNFNFIGQMRFFVLLSVALVVLSFVLMFTRDWNLGIDFSGGTVLQLQVPAEAGEVDEGRLREAMDKIDYPGRKGEPAIVRIGPPEDRSFRISVPVSQEEVQDLSILIFDGLSKELGGELVQQSVGSIGGRVGQELRSAGIKALVISWVLILIYIWFCFDVRFAPGAVIALIHDVVVTVGVFVAFGLEFDLNVLASLLVVIGYSLNDTIVIYDRIRENFEARGATHVEEVVNDSINQTLSRTILTSGLTLAVVSSLFFFGGPVLFGFSLALLIGIGVGTYSSIYVASATLIFLEHRLRKTPEQTKAKARA